MVRQSASLKEIIIRGKVVDAIPQYSFYNCPQLSSVTANDNEIAFSKYAFGNCKALRYLKAPNMKSAGEATFFGHTAALPLSIDFSERTVDYAPTLHANAFSNSAGSIFCTIPESMQETFETADVWSTLVSNGTVTLVPAQQS